MAVPIGLCIDGEHDDLVKDDDLNDDDNRGENDDHYDDGDKDRDVDDDEDKVNDDGNGRTTLKHHHSSQESCMGNNKWQNKKFATECTDRELLIYAVES